MLAQIIVVIILVSILPIASHVIGKGYRRKLKTLAQNTGFEHSLENTFLGIGKISNYYMFPFNPIGTLVQKHPKDIRYIYMTTSSNSVSLHCVIAKQKDGIGEFTIGQGWIFEEIVKTDIEAFDKKYKISGTGAEPVVNAIKNSSELQDFLLSVSNPNYLSVSGKNGYLVAQISFQFVFLPKDFPEFKILETCIAHFEKI